MSKKLYDAISEVRGSLQGPDAQISWQPTNTRNSESHSRRARIAVAASFAALLATTAFLFASSQGGNEYNPAPTGIENQFEPGGFVGRDVNQPAFQEQQFSGPTEDGQFITGGFH
jgi:hypothetical protein